MTARRAAMAPLLIVLAACAIAFGLRLGGHGIMDLDEGLYAACAREMLHTGDLVTPRVNGTPFYEKPPLIYWSAAASMRLFGENEAAARLPSALASALTCLLAAWLALRLAGRRAAAIAGVSMALSPIPLAAGRMLTTDATLDLLVAVATLALYAGLTHPDRRRLAAIAVGALACGLGVLAKGAPGIVLPCLILGVYAVVARRSGLHPLAWPGWPAALGFAAIVLAVALPWHIAAWRANGDAFMQEYIVRQHFGRFRGGDTSHQAPFWFFVPGFLLGFMPWSPFAATALLSRIPEAFRPRASGYVLLRIWALCVFLVFSASGSKLVSYILPMYPPASVLGAAWCVYALRGRRASWGMAAGGLTTALLCWAVWAVLQHPDAAVAVAQRYNSKPIAPITVPADLLAAAAHLALILGLGGLLTALLAVSARPAAALAALGGSMAAFVGVAVLEAMPRADALLSAPVHELVALATRADSRRVILISRSRRPSALFYASAEAVTAHRVLEVKDAAGAVAAMAGRDASVVAASEDMGRLSMDAALEAVERCGGWVWARATPRRYLAGMDR
ncbi:MAG: glycosyltransferase family 39 protein [Armatimonadetes bacterium]|nr:glycosyltransferase family 39 protein [Armatimonadota bacterium]